jgi:hypothetical protein
MTHTLHRTFALKEETEEFVFLSMAAQGYNSTGSVEKLKEVFRVFEKYPHTNLADDNRGGIFTGVTCEEILDNANEKAYMGAVFTDRDVVREVLKELKAKDLQMSVVVTGNIKAIFELLGEVDLVPHTVNLSLGIHGKKELLETEAVRAVTSMCGHGMISPASVRSQVRKIRNGLATPEEASLDLAKACTCGIFNPKRAQEVFEAIREGEVLP